jgi:hypothetical protein
MKFEIIVCAALAVLTATLVANLVHLGHSVGVVA